MEYKWLLKKISEPTGKEKLAYFSDAEVEQAIKSANADEKLKKIISHLADK
jgi:hypothetical protein